MGTHIKNDAFDELGQEISLLKGGPGTQSGGSPPGQSGGHREPGGECFAPLMMITDMPLTQHETTTYNLFFFHIIKF